MRLRRVLLSLLYWALGILGVLLVARWASAPDPLMAQEGQVTRARATGVVYGKERLGQIVEVPRDGLAAVQFWLLAHRRDSDGAVILRVTAPEDPDHPLALVTLPLRDLPEQPPVTFKLPPFDSIRTPALELTLEAPDLDRAHAVSVLGAGNFYGGGMLMVNGKPRPNEDLAFQLWGQPLHGDTLVPLTRMAMGRPWLFGQPLLYLTLLWLVLWAYGWLLVGVLHQALRYVRAPSAE